MSAEEVERLGYEAAADRVARGRRPRRPMPRSAVYGVRVVVLAIALVGEFYLSLRGALDASLLWWVMLATAAMLFGTVGRLLAGPFAGQ